MEPRQKCSSFVLGLWNPGTSHCLAEPLGASAQSHRNSMETAKRFVSKLELIAVSYGEDRPARIPCEWGHRGLDPCDGASASAALTRRDAVVSSDAVEGFVAHPNVSSRPQRPEDSCAAFASACEKPAHSVGRALALDESLAKTNLIGSTGRATERCTQRRVRLFADSSQDTPRV